jgi:integrase/recombinase XerD
LSIADKSVSPQVLRNAAACHLLKAGVDINTIRAWLGHVSLDTTIVYAEIDLDMKSRVLATYEINGGKTKPWWRDVGLMAFLKSL